MHKFVIDLTSTVAPVVKSPQKTLARYFINIEWEAPNPRITAQTTHRSNGTSLSCIGVHFLSNIINMCKMCVNYVVSRVSIWRLEVRTRRQSAQHLSLMMFTWNSSSRWNFLRLSLFFLVYIILVLVQLPCRMCLVRSKMFFIQIVFCENCCYHHDLVCLLGYKNNWHNNNHTRWRMSYIVRGDKII